MHTGQKPLNSGNKKLISISFQPYCASMISLNTRGQKGQLVYQICRHRDYDEALAILVRLALSGNETIIAVLADLYRKKKILEGSVLPFIFLGIGVIFQRAHVPEIDLLLLNIGGVIIILGFMLPFFTGRTQGEMERLARKAKEAKGSDNTDPADAPASDG